MQWKALLPSLLVSASSVHALLRFACSQLVVERLDPLLSPNAVSGHVHQIVGGSAFNVTMDPANDLPSLSKCTTCTFTEDFSNYWTAILYFHHPNGSFHRVPQLPGQLLGAANAGMTIYYLQPNNGAKVTAFKKGFRMIVGDAMLRTFDSSNAEAKSLNFRCLDVNGGNSGVTGSPGSDSNQLPDHPCLGGIRSQIIFPSCWDGVNLDSANHKSHVAYPSGTSCPSTHPVQIPSLFIETIWDTTQFNSMWPSGTPQPFVYSMGDPVGVGQHADYMFGWKGDALQRAMDSCNDFGGSCPTLQSQSISAINSCQQTSRITEAYDGWLSALPGCNGIQSGPGRATQQTGCGAPTTWTGADPTGGGGSGGTGPSSTASAPPTQTSSSSGAQQSHYGQCGGTGYSGPSTCQSPYTCSYSNAYYSQCL